MIRKQYYSNTRESGGNILVLLVLLAAGLVWLYNNSSLSRTAGYVPLGKPTISKELYIEELQDFKSPALMEAAGMYDACVKQGCDPALQLGFFWVESMYGTAPGSDITLNTRSVGNIRCMVGELPCYKGFKVYGNWTEGVTAWARLMQAYRTWHWDGSLTEVISHYAPNSDNNNESKYVNLVVLKVDSLRGQTAARLTNRGSYGTLDPDAQKS